MGKLTLKNCVFYGYHGVQDFEKELGGPFEVDVRISYPFSRCTENDDLNHAIDYQSVYEFVKQCVTQHKFHLVETLSELIANGILQNFDVEEVTITLRKTKVPINAIMDYVEVEITRNKVQN